MLWAWLQKNKILFLREKKRELSQYSLAWEAALTTNTPELMVSKCPDAPTNGSHSYPTHPFSWSFVLLLSPPEGLSVLDAQFPLFVEELVSDKDQTPAHVCRPIAHLPSSCIWYLRLHFCRLTLRRRKLYQDLMLLALLRICSAVGFKGSNWRF